MPRDRLNRSVLNAVTLMTMFVAGMVGYLRYAGTSPIAWTDTLSDEHTVQRCLVENACTLEGMGTSIPGLVHGVGWLEVRTLLARLGLDVNGVHLLMQVLNALMVLLTFHVAKQLAGPLAGSLAVAILGVTYVRFTALYNTSPLPFLGAVFVLACTAAVERPGVPAVVLAALVAAVMANIHMACVVTGVSVVWVALLAPRRRFALAGLGAVSFALATFLVAPPGWLHNLASVLQPHDANAPAARAMPVPYGDLYWMQVASVAWVASFAGRDPVWVTYRRQCSGALAVLIPFLAAFSLAAHLGVDPRTKYLAHLKPAGAIAVAVPIALLARARCRNALSRRILRSLEQILPFVAALMVAVPAPSAFLADDERTPTMRDLAAVGRMLHSERGWNMPAIFERLKTPQSALVFTAIQRFGSVPSGPMPAAADLATTALLLRLGADVLPQPVPPNWRVVRRSTRAATVMVFMPSTRIDWSTFQICTQPADAVAPACSEGSMRLDATAPIVIAPGMPSPIQRRRGTLTLQVPLRPPAPESVEAIFMPRMRDVCGGYIVSPTAPGLDVSADRRHAILSAPPAGATPPATLALQWHILAPECDGTSYDGLPPFFVEGDRDSVRFLEGIIERAGAEQQ